MWRCGGLNPGPFTCKANALPLSYIPVDNEWENIYYIENEPRLTKPFIDDIRNISSNRIWNISRFASEMGLNFRAKYLPASWFGSRFENFLNRELKIFHGINDYSRFEFSEVQ